MPQTTGRAREEQPPSTDAIQAAAATGALVVGSSAAPAAAASAGLVTGAQVAAAVAGMTNKLRRKGMASGDEGAWLWLINELEDEMPEVPESFLRHYVRREIQYEQSFWRNMEARLRRDLPQALAEPDAQRAVESILARERNWMRAHHEASTARVRGAARADQVKVLSPEGGYWRMSAAVKEHTPDCIAMATVGWWPWGVLDRIQPPVHVGCRCELLTHEEAHEHGLMGRAVPDSSGAAQKAAQLMADYADLQQAFWAEDGTVEEMAELIDRIVVEGESQPSPLQAIPACDDELEEAAENLLDPYFIEEVAIARYAKGTIWGGRFKPHRGAAAAPIKELLKALKERHKAPEKRGMPSVGVQPSKVGTRAVEKAQEAIAARPSGTPPRSFAAAAEDVKSLAAQVAGEHHASLVLGEVKINPDGFDTSGMRYADGSVEIGPEAEVSLREFAGYVDRGETPPDDVAASAYMAQRTMIHESMHSVNPMAQGEYSTTPWAMAMEEALTEEMAHDLAVRQLRDHGGHAALDWAGRAGPEDIRAQGVYQVQRASLARLLDEAHVPLEERRPLLERLKFETAPPSRLDVLGNLIAKAQGISAEDGKAMALLTMGRSGKEVEREGGLGKGARVLAPDNPPELGGQPLQVGATVRVQDRYQGRVTEAALQDDGSIQLEVEVKTPEGKTWRYPDPQHVELVSPAPERKLEGEHVNGEVAEGDSAVVTQLDGSKLPVTIRRVEGPDALGWRAQAVSPNGDTVMLRPSSVAAVEPAAGMASPGDHTQADDLWRHISRLSPREIWDASEGQAHLEGLETKAREAGRGRAADVIREAIDGRHEHMKGLPTQNDTRDKNVNLIRKVTQAAFGTLKTKYPAMASPGDLLHVEGPRGFDARNYSDPRRSLITKVRAMGKDEGLKLADGTTLVRGHHGDSVLIRRPDGSRRRYATVNRMANTEIAGIEARHGIGVLAGMASPSMYDRGPTANKLLGPYRDTLEKFTAGGWDPERRKLHQEIRDHFLEGHKAPEGKPTALFLSGGPGSGKSSLVENNLVELPEDAVMVNPDLVKEMLPEYQAMVAARDPASGAAVHEESSLLAREIRAEAEKRKLNLVIDGVGDSHPGRFNEKLNEFHSHGYDVSVVVAALPPDKGRSRIAIRAEKTGRSIPPAAVTSMYERVPRRFAEYEGIPWLDLRVYSTDTPIGGTPELIASKPPGQETLTVERPVEMDAFRSSAEASFAPATPVQRLQSDYAVGATPYVDGPQEGFYGTPLYVNFEDDVARIAASHDLKVDELTQAGGVWAGGKEPSAQLLIQGDRAEVTEFMDELGSRFDQEAVIGFISNDNGASMRYISQDGERPVTAEEVAKALEEVNAGRPEAEQVKGATALPDGKLELLDLEDTAQPAIQALAQKLGIRFAYDRGDGFLRSRGNDYAEPGPQRRSELRALARGGAPQGLGAGDSAGTAPDLGGDATGLGGLPGRPAGEGPGAGQASPGIGPDGRPVVPPPQAGIAIPENPTAMLSPGFSMKDVFGQLFPEDFGGKGKKAKKALKAKEVHLSMVEKPPEPVTGIPDYSDAKLTDVKSAGGSTGARMAKDKKGNGWLVKPYKGQQDRVATELLANAIYRDLGILVANAGTLKTKTKGKKGKPDEEHIALTYPLIAGDTRRWQEPDETLAEGFVADALLANWDVIGLGMDNILWTTDGEPMRVDQGGTLEYRAQGGPKDFGPVPTEMWTLQSPAGGQAHGRMDITEAGMKAAAKDVALRLTPARLDELVDSAPFQDEEMRERVRENLKARVGWLSRYADGKEEFPHPTDGGETVESLVERDANFITEPEEDTELLGYLTDPAAVDAHLHSKKPKSAASKEVQKTVEVLDRLLDDEGLKTWEDSYGYFPAELDELGVKDPSELPGRWFQEQSYLSVGALPPKGGTVMKLLIPANSQALLPDALSGVEDPVEGRLLMPRQSKIQVTGSHLDASGRLIIEGLVKTPYPKFYASSSFLTEKPPT